MLNEIEYRIQHDACISATATEQQAMMAAIGGAQQNELRRTRSAATSVANLKTHSNHFRALELWRIF
jgi:hypothetical protein